MRLGALVVVAGHDALDLRRQRGVWVGLLLIPFVTVSFLLLLPGILAEREQSNAARARFRVAVEVANRAGSTESPEAAAAFLGAGLPRERFEVRASADARSAVSRGRADVGVVLTNDVAAAVADPPAQVEGELLLLGARTRSRAAVSAFAQALERFGLEITDRRLTSRGVSTATVRPFVVTPVDLSSTERGRRLNLATLLPLLVLLPVAGTVGVAAQRISGSKDQRAFEPLLVLPFTRPELLLGKALSSLCVGSITLVAVGLPLVAGRVVPVGSGAAGRFVQLPLGDIFGVIGIGALLLVLLVALGVAVGAASRTSAELGSVLQLTTLPIFLLGSFLQFRSEIVTTPLLLALPFFGPLLCVRDIAIGSWTGPEVAVAVVSSLAWSAAFVALGAAILDRSHVVLRSTS